MKIRNIIIDTLFLAALLMVIMPKQAAAEDNFETAGKIEALSATSLTINGESIPLTSTTKIMLDGKVQLDATTLKRDMFAIVKGFNVLSMKIATSVFARDSSSISTRIEGEGKITAKTDTSLTVNNFTFVVNNKTSIFLSNDSTVSFGYLTVGMDVEVKGFAQSGINYALLINVQS